MSPHPLPVRLLFQCLFVSLLIVPITRAQAPVPDRHSLEKGNLLVADANLINPLFGRSVILILDHDESGTYGLMLNKISNLDAREVWPDANWADDTPAVFLGGPVQMHTLRLLVYASRQPVMSKAVTEKVWLLDTREGLELYLRNTPQSGQSSLFFGYTGWAAGQLEAEIFRGDWHIHSGRAALIFHPAPEELWLQLEESMQQLWTTL